MQQKNLVESLSFIINYEKSKIEPSRKCEFLGFILDSKQFSVYLNDGKRKSIFEKVSRLFMQKLIAFDV